MTKTFASAMILLLALTMARPVSAEEFGTFVRASARVDVSGRTELVIHKAYAGQMGSIRDVISMQNAGPDGYPKVEIATSGAIQATRGNGGIVVESTGPGLGEIDVYVTFNGLRSTWWLQAGEVPGVGAVRLNATAVFGDGLHAAKQGNHVAVRGVDGHETTIIDDGAHGNAWSTNATIPAGSIVLFDIAGEPDRVAPLWMTLTSLGLALISLALSGYLALKLRSATSLRNPSK